MGNNLRYFRLEKSWSRTLLRGVRVGSVRHFHTSSRSCRYGASFSYLVHYWLCFLRRDDCLSILHHPRRLYAVIRNHDLWLWSVRFDCTVAGNLDMVGILLEIQHKRKDRNWKVPKQSVRSRRRNWRIFMWWRFLPDKVWQVPSGFRHHYARLLMHSGLCWL